MVIRFLYDLASFSLILVYLWWFQIEDVKDGKACGPNASGEICVKGPQLMQGYLNRPDATEQIFDKDGFLHTGWLVSLSESVRKFVSFLSDFIHMSLF